MLVNPWTPEPGTNQLISTTGTTQPLVLSTKSKCVRIVNYGATNAAYVRVGVGVQTCTAADQVVRANSELIIYKGEGANGIGVLQLTGATTLAISTGDGGT